MGEQPGEGERPKATGGLPSLRTAAGEPARGSDARFVVGVAALFAIPYALVNAIALFQIQLGSFTGLLARFGFWTATAFCGIAPAIALLLVLERGLPVARGKRWKALAAGVLLAAAVATPLQMGASVGLGHPEALSSAWDWAHVASNQLTWIALVAVWRESLWQRRATLAALHESELRSVALQGQVAEAELQLLQAQIEPHFLFNSLANLRRLGRLDATAGQAMLADLLQYLQQTLPRLRETDSTLAREAEVARAYLAVHKVRMGERLEVEFAIPADLGATPVPPMMLLTLIENALKHGLGPLPEGGRIRVAAEPAGAAVRLSVADTGRGLVPGRGTGTGLTNLRARLRTLHGANASIFLQVNQPRGVVASIVLPRA